MNVWGDEIEYLPGAREEVTTGIRSDQEVAGGVHTDQLLGKLALHDRLEVIDSRILRDQVRNVSVRERCLSAPSGDVSPQTSRVVSKTRRERIGRSIGHHRRDGAQVDRHVLERTGRDASATYPGRDDEVRVAVGWDTVRFVFTVYAVAADRRGRTIERWGVDGVLRVLRPVEVRLVAGITTLITKGLLVRPGEIAVPREKVALLVVSALSHV